MQRTIRMLGASLVLSAICAGASFAEDGEGGKHLSGFLSAAQVPASLALIPPPPAEGSAALALDREIAQRSFTLRGTARWAQARTDANLSFPFAAGTFACAVGSEISESATPTLYRLLQRSEFDLGATTRSAKTHYQRPRPFMVNKEPTCTPEDEARLVKSGSYPSGHTSMGWGWALILAEVAPDRTEAILARGLSFGESRNVCNVHWHSDVVQGRVVAASTIARLHASEAFRAELAAAKQEIAAARAKGLKPQRDCAAEAQALATQPSLAQ